jgi:hypothetical protein
MNKINTATLVSLAKALDTELKSREDLAPGIHAVSDSVNLTLSGSVEVNEPETYTPTINIPLKVTMALFVRYSGITGAAALKALEKAMSEALTLDKKAVKLISELAVLEQAEEKVTAMLGELPKAERKGKTFVKVEVNGL